MEAHMVHWNSKYRTFEEASCKPDGLAVVAFFIECAQCLSHFSPARRQRLCASRGGSLHQSWITPLMCSRGGRRAGDSAGDAAWAHISSLLGRYLPRGVSVRLRPPRPLLPSMEETIQVAVRVRPLCNSELATGCQPCVDCIPNEPQVVVRNTDKAFTYNFVFGPDSSQQEVYETAVKRLVNQLFKGYNVTILAYGQTGSGKTYSMGTCYDGEGEMGIIPRSISDIFEKIAAENPDAGFKVSVSFLEIYKEQVYDLLACSSKPRDQCIVNIRRDSRGVQIPGLMDMEVFCAADTFKAIAMGSSSRATGSTAMNAQSSRSHAIFTITMQMEKKKESGGNMVSKFHLVDLAGSERSKKTGAIGERFQEGVNINKGLLALGNVIFALGDKKPKGFVSYRDSKLTRLLQDSLGGNSKTLMVACVSPADINCEETVSTLRYADRARQIRNKPIINQDPKAAEILRLQKENTELRLQLIGNGGGTGLCPKEHSQLQKKIDLLKGKNRKLTEALNDVISENTNLMERALLAEAARDRMNMKLKELSEIIENFDQSKEYSPSSSLWKNRACLKDIHYKIAKLQAEQLQGEEEIKRHELSELSASSHMSGGQVPDTSMVDAAKNTLLTPSSIAEFDQQEEKHTLQQAELNKELQELTRALAIKEQLARALVSNSSSFSSLSPEYRENMKQLENQINTLQQERDTLQQQLKSSQANNASSKIAEQRRKRLQELEVQMSELKKKLLEQSKIIKMKEKDDEKAMVLDNEIRSMKAKKKRLICQMKQESEQFRTWKLERQKELNKLRDQDRKGQNIMTRMETMHTKQQYVLKRKVEEAAAINKRLKDALQHAAGRPERVQAWVSQELEVSASTVAAMRVRENLVEDRALISEQLGGLEKTVATALPSEMDTLKQEVSRLKEDLELHSAQIADINRKILDSDQENKSETRWDSIQSMVDAKCALKFLFENAVELKTGVAMKDNTIEELQESAKKLKVELKEAERNLGLIEQKYKAEFLQLEKENAEKVAVLLHKLRQAESGNPVTTETDCELREKIKLLEDENKHLRSVYDDYENVTTILENVKALVEHSNKPKAKKGVSNISKKKSIEESTKKSPTNVAYTDFSDDEVVMTGDEENDPDWRKTPLWERLPNIRRKTTIMDNTFVVKRTSDGSPSCSCKTNCSRCACRNGGFSSSVTCKYDPIKCTNRSKENSSDFTTGFDSAGDRKRLRTDSPPSTSGFTWTARKYFPPL